MGIHLETFLENHPSSKYLFTEDDNKLAPKQLKNPFSTYLGDNIYQQEQYKDLAPQDSKDGDITTHSVQKCSAEYATNCGVIANEIEICG